MIEFYTREEASAAVRRIFKEASDLANCAREYRIGKGLRKGTEIEPAIEDFMRWMQYGEESLIKYGRPEFRLKVFKFMRLMERLCAKVAPDENKNS